MAAGEFYAVGAEGGPRGLAGERLVDQALGFGVEGGGVAARHAMALADFRTSRRLAGEPIAAGGGGVVGVEQVEGRRRVVIEGGAELVGDIADPRPHV